MIDPSVLPSFLTAVAVIVMVPGPDMAFVVASGVEGGRAAAARAALGITMGVTVYVIATAAGLGALLSSSPSALGIVRGAGAIYLVVLGVRAWRRAATPLDSSGHGPTGRYFRRGFVVNITNPKIAIFFAAFLPQFVAPDRGPAWVQLVILGVALQATGLMVDFGVGMAAGTAQHALSHRRGAHLVLQRSAATVYLVLGAIIAIEVAGH